MLSTFWPSRPKRCKACNKPGQRQGRRSRRSSVRLQRCRHRRRHQLAAHLPEALWLVSLKVSEFVAAALVFIVLSLRGGGGGVTSQSFSNADRSSRLGPRGRKADMSDPVAVGYSGVGPVLGSRALRCGVACCWRAKETLWWGPTCLSEPSDAVIVPV